MIGTLAWIIMADPATRTSTVIAPNWPKTPTERMNCGSSFFTKANDKRKAADEAKEPQRQRDEGEDSIRV